MVGEQKRIWFVRECTGLAHDSRPVLDEIRGGGGVEEDGMVPGSKRPPSGCTSAPAQTLLRKEQYACLFVLFFVLVFFLFSAAVDDR